MLRFFEKPTSSIWIPWMLLAGCCSAGSESTLSLHELSRIRTIGLSASVSCEDPEACPSLVAMMVSPKIAGNSRRWKNSVQWCSGVLISETRFLTNAHCVPEDLRQAGASCSGRSWFAFPQSGSLPAENVECARVVSVTRALTGATDTQQTELEPDLAVLELKRSVHRKGALRGSWSELASNADGRSEGNEPRLVSRWSSVFQLGEQYSDFRTANHIELGAEYRGMNPRFGIAASFSWAKTKSESGWDPSAPNGGELASSGSHVTARRAYWNLDGIYRLWGEASGPFAGLRASWILHRASIAPFPYSLGYESTASSFGGGPILGYDARLSESVSVGLQSVFCRQPTVLFKDLYQSTPIKLPGSTVVQLGLSLRVRL